MFEIIKIKIIIMIETKKTYINKIKIYCCGNGRRYIPFNFTPNIYRSKLK